MNAPTTDEMTLSHNDSKEPGRDSVVIGKSDDVGGGKGVQRASNEGRGVARYFLLLLVILSLCYFIVGTYRNWPYKIESDGKYYYQYLVSGYFDHDFDFTNNYLAVKYPWMNSEIDLYKLRNRVSPLTGRPSNVFTIGPAILWTPFFLAAQIGADLLNKIGFQIDVNPWGKFFQYTVMYSGVVYTVATLYLLYRLLVCYFPDKTSLYATWLLLIATNLFYYTVFEPSMSHVYDLFTYAAYLFLFVKTVRSNRLVFYFALAITGALHVLVRTQNVVTILLFSVLLLLIPPVSQKKFPSFKLAGTYAATLFIGLLPVPLVNNYLFGNPFVIPQGTAYLDLANPHIWGVLFSLRNGLFSQHPILLLGAIGFTAFLSNVILTRSKEAGIGSVRSTQGRTSDSDSCLPMPSQEATLFYGTMLITFIFQVYINSTARDWWAGDSFGQRRLISSFPLFAFGLAYGMQRIQRLSPKLNALGIGVFSIAGIYLTYMYIFLWSYDEPHNIVAWMFYYAPREIIRLLHQR